MPRVQKNRKRVAESDLRGALSNDSLSDDEKEQLELERQNQEKSAAIKLEDYQISVALDLIKGLSIYDRQKLN